MAQTGASRDNGHVSDHMLDRDPASTRDEARASRLPHLARGEDDADAQHFGWNGERITSVSPTSAAPSLEHAEARNASRVAELSVTERAADLAAENAALQGIARAIHDSPHDVLGAMLDVARAALHLPLAGVSLLEGDNDGHRRLRAARLSRDRSAGAADAPAVNDEDPAFFDDPALATCIARRAALVFRHTPEQGRAFADVTDLLTVPLRDRHDTPIGVVWFASLAPPAERGAASAFDREHVRVAESLVSFAGQVYAGASERVERERQHAAERYAHKELAVVCEQLRWADARKDEFLAMLGHELRNPLGAVANAVALLESQADTPPRTGALVDVVRRQTRVMTQLLDDLLDVSRITMGKMELRCARVDLAHVIHHVVGNVGKQAAARRHTLRLDIDADLFCNADPTRIEQVLSNLLTNAIKYTDPGGHIDVRAGRQGGEIVIGIVDDGLGIPRSFLPHVFDLFSQGGVSNSRAHGGLGLGLALVRKIVELHGGSVEARSEGPGTGSEFIVRLPCAPVSTVAESERTGEPSGSSRPSRRIRVLVIDDDIDSAALAGEMVTLLGHDVTVVNDALGALEIASRSDWELVLLDIGLPGIDGYEVSRRLRMGRQEKARLVAVSGFGGLEDRYRSMAAGCDEHLVKPVGMNDLRGVLARAMDAEDEPATLREHA